VTIDYGFIARRLVEVSSKCPGLRCIKYDRWRIDDLKAALSALGIEMPLEDFGQGYKDMAPAIDALEVVALQSNMRHGMHPILSWNASNAVITPNPAGDRKFDKAMATARIDGMVALAMAIGAGTKQDGDGGSIYGTPERERGLLIL
jgi:phage terminase large subunit-like protein